MTEPTIQPGIDPPIMLEPGLRYAGCGTTSDGRMWLKFINVGVGKIRAVIVTIVAKEFHYHYAMRDKATDTIIGYQGTHGDPTKDESFIWGAKDFE